MNNLISEKFQQIQKINQLATDSIIAMNDIFHSDHEYIESESEFLDKSVGFEVFNSNVIENTVCISDHVTFY